MASLATFSGRIAHEFNNVMNSIMNTAALLKMTGNLSPEMAELVDLIDRSTRRGADLTMALMSFARPVTPQFRVAELNGLCGTLCSGLRKKAPAGVQIELTPALEPMEISVDEVLLAQVFSALFDNAVEAMGSSGKVHVSVVPVRDAGQPPVARIVFADTGPGVPEPYRAQIFDPLFSTRQGVKGTGFGLGRAYRLMRDMGGHLELGPVQPEKGAEFWLEFPLSVPEARLGVYAPASKLAGTLRVLLADDDEANRLLGSRLLEKFGHTITVARDGLEALQIFQAASDRFDVLVVDESMPGLSGTEVIEMARKIRPGMPGVLVSGAEGSAGSPPLAGVARILKPYDAEGFLQTVSSVAASRSEKPGA